MAIRWKLFLILLVFSLVPLGVLTLISQRGTSRMGSAISEDVGQNLTRIADRILKLTAEKSGEILAKNSTAVAFGLMWLAREAESALATGAPMASKIYFSHEFDDPQTAPTDFKFHPDNRAASPLTWVAETPGASRKTGWVKLTPWGARCPSAERRR